MSTRRTGATLGRIKVTVALAGPFRRSLATALRLAAVGHQVLEWTEGPELVTCPLCEAELQRAPTGEGRGGHARCCPIPKLRDHVDAVEQCIAVKVHPPKS